MHNEPSPLARANEAHAARIAEGAGLALAAVAALHPEEQVAALVEARNRLHAAQIEAQEKAELARLAAKYPVVA